jgi:hypothetical protein
MRDICGDTVGRDVDRAIVAAEVAHQVLERRAHGTQVPTIGLIIVMHHLDQVGECSISKFAHTKG